ncbi:MAG: CYTH and CHAD domain-containing protein [Rhodomicrobium sp.]
MTRARREFELKLSLTGEELDRLAGNAKLASAEQSNCALRSVYYDTEDYRLHQEGISLRVRDNGKGFVQTVKLDANLTDGILNPIEIEDRVYGPAPALDRIGDKRVRRRVANALKSLPLTPAFETNVQRTLHRLRKRASLMELAIDRGETLARGKRSQICEAEIELVEGNPKDLLATAQSLFAKNAVRLSPASKAEGGYQLLLDEQAPAKIEPSHAAAPDVQSGQSCGQAFAAIFRSARDQIVKNRTVVLQTGEAEGVHQLRVGLTRLRTAQRVVKPLVKSPQLEQLETDAQAIARAVGELRDADVLIEDIYAPVTSDPPPEGFDQLQTHRASKLQEVRHVLNGAVWSRLLLSLTLWPFMLERDPSLENPVDDYAGKALQKRWKKAAKLGRDIECLEGAKQHQMRKVLKKLRYTSEFFAPLYQKKEVKPFLKELKKLQDVFGYANDVRMAGQVRQICAARCGGEEPAACSAAGYILGYHEAKVQDVWKSAPHCWRRLRRRRRFWH